MKWHRSGDDRVSDCGNYRIESVGWERGRTSTFSLSVKLDDGWISYPEAFARLRDAKAEAERMEE